MMTSQIIYRGFRICTFSKGNAWSFSASPLSPYLPILSHYSVSSKADTEALALAEAKEHIDLHLRSIYLLSA